MAATAAPWSDMTPEDDVKQAEFLGPSFAVAMFSGVDVSVARVVDAATVNTNPWKDHSPKHLTALSRPSVNRSPYRLHRNHPV